jgi:hypothetical protein
MSRPAGCWDDGRNGLQQPACVGKVPTILLFFTLGILIIIPLLNTVSLPKSDLFIAILANISFKSGFDSNMSSFVRNTASSKKCKFFPS